MSKGRKSAVKKVVSDTGHQDSGHKIVEFESESFEQGNTVVKALLFGKQQTPEREGPHETFPHGSQQIEEDTFETGLLATQIVEPPTDPVLWASAMEQSTRLFKSIHTFARNVVGLGWEVVPKQGVSLKDDAVRVRFEAEKALIVNLFGSPNSLMPFTTLMFLVKVDEEATGNGYLELVRNIGGQISQMFHVPSHTLRVRKGGIGYIQIRGGKKKYFKNFGDTKQIDAFTGAVSNQVLPLEKRASEIIQFKIYCPRSSFYGIPRYVASGPAIGGNRMAATRNFNFFENDATPRMIITVSGGALDAESIKRIEEFARQKVKNTKNAHRVLVMQIEPKRAGLGKDTVAKIEVHPLTVGVIDDASFQKYREANDDEVRQAFGISEVFFSMAGVNRANALIGRNITNQQEFEPDRLEKEYVLNQTILKEMGITIAEFKFLRPENEDEESQARINRMLAESGALTPNEMREELGRPPFPADFTFANKPFRLALEELRLGVALAIAQTQKQPAMGPPAQISASVAQGVDGLIDTLIDMKKSIDGKIKDGKIKITTGSGLPSQEELLTGEKP